MPRGGPFELQSSSAHGPGPQRHDADCLWHGACLSGACAPEETDGQFFIPVFKNQYPWPPGTDKYPANRSTGLTVVNVDEHDISELSLTVTYVGGSCTPGDSVTTSVNVPVHEFRVFYHPTEAEGWSEEFAISIRF